MQCQRVLKQYGQNRKPCQESVLSDIEQAIQKELTGSGSLLGYRGMWHKLKHSYHLTVKRLDIMYL